MIRLYRVALTLAGIVRESPGSEDILLQHHHISDPGGVDFKKNCLQKRQHFSERKVMLCTYLRKDILSPEVERIPGVTLEASSHRLDWRLGLGGETEEVRTL